MANGHSAEGIEATAGRDFEDDLRGTDVGLHDPRYPKPNWGSSFSQKQQQDNEEEAWQMADQKEIDKQQIKHLSGKENLTKISEAFKKPFPLREVLDRPAKGQGSKLLHYIDARSVMKRLDDVVGVENWQSKFIETNSGTRVLCELSVRLGGEWITKTDGSGDTDFEKEKGAISRALVRAATNFGIGRYLYNPKAFKNNIPATWATPEGYDKMMSEKDEQK